ncbi:MAG: exo-alpha-sialidase [Lentisphaerae bacterium]|nr:exo-alpha-sialidase [Lentisphaerota bacterium]
MEPTLTLPTALPLAPPVVREAAEPITIDLAQRAWQGIPGLERTAKGRVFLSWFTGGPKEPAPENTVVLSHSDDAGKTFCAPQAMALPLSDGTRCYDPCLWIDPKGRLWFLFNRSVKDSTRHGVYARVCDAPDAALPAFGAEFRVGFDGPFSFRMNKPIALSTGEWIMPVTHALEPVAGWAGFDPKQVQAVGISADEGKIWTLHGAVKLPGASLENMIVELRDGRLWMLIRTARVLWESHSSNKGRTWTEASPTTIATPHSRFFIRRLASGRLLLVNHYRFTGRSHLTAQLSTDDGATWNDGLVLDERGGPDFPNGVPGGVSYPDGVQDQDGLIWITYDRDRNGLGEILLAKFREEDVLAGKSVSGAVTLKQIVSTLDRPPLLPANWDPALAGDAVMQRLVKVTAPQVKGAHDAEFVCMGDRAYVVSEANDLMAGENGDWPFIYSTLSIVNLKTLETERVIDFAKGEQAFANETLPPGACWVPRIIQKDPQTLRCYFVSQAPARRQSQMWYRDFDLSRGEFASTIHKAKLKTAAGIFDFQPQHFHADAAAHGFRKKASDSFFFIFDSFKKLGFCQKSLRQNRA